MTSFKAQTGRDRLIMREKKNRYNLFKPDPKQGIPKKIAKKLKKTLL